MGYKQRLLLLVGISLLAGILAASAAGSQLIDRNATGVRLAVARNGVAMLTYRAHGRTRRVLAWGAINALAPHPRRRQVRFRLDYSGGGARGGLPHWRRFLRNACAPYDGPPLRWLLTACKAPDGSYWAVQAWQRSLPNHGLRGTRARRAWDLRLSHWRGEIAELTLRTDWAYGRYHHVYGRLIYRGAPVHGFRSTRRGAPLDSYGRNVYLDTYHSLLGRGWRRENSFLTHKPTGIFCYGLYSYGGRPGTGKLYRATVAGPGVTPDVAAEVQAPGPFDPLRELQSNAEQRHLFNGSRRCRPK